MQVGICMDGTTIVSPEAYLALEKAMNAQQVRVNVICFNDTYHVALCLRHQFLWCFHSGAQVAEKYCSSYNAGDVKVRA